MLQNIDLQYFVVVACRTTNYNGEASTTFAPAENSTFVLNGWSMHALSIIIRGGGRCGHLSGPTTIIKGIGSRYKG